MSYPYLARTTLKYKSPHATDLSFAKDETIRVTGPSDDDEDWLVGETLDGSKKGGFPKDFISRIEEEATEDAATAAEDEAPAKPAEPIPRPSTPPLPAAAPVPVSPKLDTKSLPPSSAASPAPKSAVIPKASTPAAAPANTDDGEEPDPAKMTMKERLAFFAAQQNKASPPPIKPKPAAGGLTWSQRQKLRQEQEAKERESGGDSTSAPVSTPSAAAAASAPAPAPAATESATQQAPVSPIKKTKEGDSGLSAADAQSSISKGGSLKERMAALQGAGAFGSPASKPTPPPKPSGKVWSRPAAPEPAEEEDEEGSGPPADRAALESLKTPTAEEDDPIAASAEGDEPEEQTEEEQEKARRAAIAARMAKLGARGPMGMARAAPPKPARKPTREAVPTASSPVDEISEPMASQQEENSPTPAEVATSPPASVAMPAIPRRTAGPRKRGGGPASSVIPAVARENPPEPEKRFDQDDRNDINPPPQVMVADEEAPIPKTEEQLDREREQENVAKGPGGSAGAKAAGIAMMPVGQDDDGVEDPDEEKEEPLVGAVGTAGSNARGMGTITDRSGPGEVIDGREDEPQEVEEGLEEGGDERDEIMAEAERGELDLDEPVDEPTMVPIHPPADDGPIHGVDEDDAPPPPPARPRDLAVGKDELELKHEQDAQEGEDDEMEYSEADNADEPPPPPARMIAASRAVPPAPGGRPPVPKTSMPAPPTGNPMVPPRDEEEEDREADGLGDEEVENQEPAPPPPPRRQPSLPGPVQIGLPTPASPAASRSAASPPTSPRVVRSPSQLAPSPVQPKSEVVEEPATEEDEEAQKRSKIAARMAKLGGFKFGMAPPLPRKPTSGAPESREGPTSPVRETPQTPIGDIPSPITSGPTQSAAGDDESPEQEAARRRATLARLKAGGALGFGMFNHGPASADPEGDGRGLEEEAEQEAPPAPPARQQPAPAIQSEDIEEQEEDEAPPPPPSSRPVVPGNRPMPPPPTDEEEEEEEDAPPPPPVASRPAVPIQRPSNINTAQAMPSSPSRALQSPMEPPASPIRSPSERRAPMPSLEKRMSQSSAMQPSIPERQSFDAGRIFSEEPAGASPIDAQEDMPPPIPSDRPGQAPPPIQTQQAASPAAPRRSLSTTSQSSRMSAAPPFSPASRQASRQDSMPGPVDAGRPSMSGARPGFQDLQNAARDSGARLAKSAKTIFDQGKRGNYGDGSPAGFVLLAMQNANLPHPGQIWGQVIFEQEASSVLKRYDEPRPGDIAALHDARLKGKKGLASYSQQVGSVEDPTVGVIVEFEAKKHKIRVLQVERGTPEEVSYRCDDLKTGRIVVYRPGL